MIFYFIDKLKKAAPKVLNLSKWTSHLQVLRGLPYQVKRFKYGVKIKSELTIKSRSNFKTA